MSEDLTNTKTQLAKVEAEQVKLEMENLKLESENSKESKVDDSLAIENAELRALVENMNGMTMNDMTMNDMTMNGITVNGDRNETTQVLEKKLEDARAEVEKVQAVADEWTNLAKVCCFAPERRHS